MLEQLLVTTISNYTDHHEVPIILTSLRAVGSASESSTSVNMIQGNLIPPGYESQVSESTTEPWT